VSISNLKWALSLAVVVIFAAYLSIEISSAVDSNDREALRTQERQLVEERCSGPEAVNRQYLQQSWFHSPEFREIAVSFGDIGFSFYKKGAPIHDSIQGAYCVDGTNLMVEYFSVDYVPIGIHFDSPLSWQVSFGRRITPSGGDTLQIRELTENVLTIAFKSSGQETTFYRKR
jgi:hypothetical protein